MSKKQVFKITNCLVDGNDASMSKANKHNLPNQAQWKSQDYDYTITLPDDTWEPVDDSCALEFIVSAGTPSCVYQLLDTAPLGLSSYSLVRTDTGQDCLQMLSKKNKKTAGKKAKKKMKIKSGQDPDVIINS
jgi:hypothetical protein